MLASGTRPFEWLNTVDLTSPLTYLHSSHNVVHPSAKNEAPEFEDEEGCCECKEATQCMDGTCSCANPRAHPQHAMHTRSGLKATGTGLDPPPDSAWVTECNSKCKCAKWRRRRCLNRVVQSEPVSAQQRLLVFNTRDRGWGALTLQRIPAWQYVCEYVGEVISDSLAESRSDKYLFSLDSKLITGGRWETNSATEPPIIDATQVGHIARFINHSCNPNCSVYYVMTEHRDPLQYRVAFFAHDDIAAGEELTINYAYKEEHKLRLFGGQCRCDHCAGKEWVMGEERKEGEGRASSKGARRSSNKGARRSSNSKTGSKRRH